MSFFTNIQSITRFFRTSLTLLVLLLSIETWSQNYPVTCTPIIKPSYSLKWSEISTSNDMFKVHLLLKDLTKISVDVYLKIRLSGVGVDIRTVDGFMPSQTLTLISGEPRMLTASDLAEYFNISNLVVDGVDISALYNGGRLPEGLYTWTVEAYEIDRNRQVSNTGMALMNVFKNYPPIINIPQDGAILPVTTPQNVLFSWTSRSTASLNAAQGKTYKLRIYPLNGDDDPNVVANSGIQPIEITTTNPFFSYGAGNIPLEKGKRYAVQVQESDDASADDYENEGKSQVITFSYGKPCVAPEGMVINPIGKGRVELTCEASAEDTETYPITAWYKTPKTLIWNSVPFNGNSTVISGLKDKTDYEFKLSSSCGDNTNTMVPFSQGDIPSGDPSTEPETFTIDDSEFDEEEPEVLDPAILDPYRIGIEINADGTTRPVETLEGIFNKIIKPECVTNADAYAECSPNHPPARAITGTIELDALAIGDVLGIYDYTVLVTAVGGGTSLSGKGLVKLPFLENSYMAVEFSGIKAKKEEMRMQGGCVYEVGDYFRTRPISQADLQNEQVRTIADIIKLTEPTVFHGDLEVAIKKYQEKGSEIASKGTATPQERQDLLTYTKSVEVAIGTWKDKFSEVFGSGETDPKIAEILGDITAILTQLNADKQTIETGTSYPTIPDLKAKIDAIIEKIKALQQENTPKPPRIQNVLATNIGYNDATLTWQGDPRFTKYVISYKTADGGELLETVTGNRLDLKKLQENSQYGFKIEGYVGDDVVDAYENGAFKTLDDIVPKPENVISQINKNGNLTIKWDKNSLHKSFILKYTDADGNERTIFPSKNEVEITNFKPDIKYTYSIIAVGANSVQSDKALGDFFIPKNCRLFKQIDVFSRIYGSASTVSPGIAVTLSVSPSQVEFCLSEIEWFKGTELIGIGKQIDVIPYERENVYIAKCSEVLVNIKTGATEACEIAKVITTIPNCEITEIKASKTLISEGEEVLFTRTNNCLNAQSSYWIGEKGIISYDQNLLVKPQIGNLNKWQLVCVNGDEKCMTPTPAIRFEDNCNKRMIWFPRVTKDKLLVTVEGCEVQGWGISSPKVKEVRWKATKANVEDGYTSSLLDMYSKQNSHILDFSKTNMTFTITAICKNTSTCPNLTKTFDPLKNCERDNCGTFVQQRTLPGTDLEEVVLVGTQAETNPYNVEFMKYLGSRGDDLSNALWLGIPKLAESLFNVNNPTGDMLAHTLFISERAKNCNGAELTYTWREINETGIKKVFEKNDNSRLIHIDKKIDYSKVKAIETESSIINNVEQRIVNEIKSQPTDVCDEQPIEVVIPAKNINRKIGDEPPSIEVIEMNNDLKYVFPKGCQNAWEEGLWLLETPMGIEIKKNSEIQPIRVGKKPWKLRTSCILSGNVYFDEYEGTKSGVELGLQVYQSLVEAAKVAAAVSGYSIPDFSSYITIVDLLKGKNNPDPTLPITYSSAPAQKSITELSEPQINVNNPSARNSLSENSIAYARADQLPLPIKKILSALTKKNQLSCPGGSIDWASTLNTAGDVVQLANIGINVISSIYNLTQIWGGRNLKLPIRSDWDKNAVRVSVTNTFFPIQNPTYGNIVDASSQTPIQYQGQNVVKKVVTDACNKMMKYNLNDGQKREVICKLYNNFTNNGIKVHNPAGAPDFDEMLLGDNGCANLNELWSITDDVVSHETAEKILAQNNTIIQSAGDGECLENSSLVVTATPKQPTCQNNDGEISVSATGGSGSYEYKLSTSTTYQGSNLFKNLKPGTYTIDVKDKDGNKGQTNINLIGALCLSSVTPKNTTCGITNGSIVVITSGGQSPITYTLNGGAAPIINNTGNFTGLKDGTYTISIEDSGTPKQTLTTLSQTIAPSKPLTLFISNIVGVTCFDGSDGKFTFKVDGGKSPHTLTSNGTSKTYTNATPFSFVRSSLESGTYALSLTDSDNCPAVNTTVNIPSNGKRIDITSTTQGASCGKSDGEMTVTASNGIAPYTYSTDGVNFSSNNPITGLAAGNYKIYAKDANGCQSEETAKVTTSGTLQFKPVTIDDGTYNGEYGWDDGSQYSQSQFLTVVAQNPTDYEKIDTKGCREYYAPWLSLLPGKDKVVSINLMLDSDLQSYINSGKKVTLTATAGIRMNGNSTFEINSSNVANSIVTEIESSITTTPTSLGLGKSITAKDEDGKLIGKLNIISGKPQEEVLNVYFLKHNANPIRTDLTISDMENALNKNSHNQGLVNYKLKFGTLAGTNGIVDISKIFNASTDKDYDKILDAIGKVNKDFLPSTKNIFITDISIINGSDRTTGQAKSKLNVFIYNKGIEKTLIHEVGHLYDLIHTFCCNLTIENDTKCKTQLNGRCLPQNTTSNFMDYNKPQKTHFDFFQWKVIFSTAKTF